MNARRIAPKCDVCTEFVEFVIDSQVCAGIKETEVQMESVNIIQLTEEVIEREKLAESDIKIKVDESIKVHANRNFLSRALSNVLQNAVRYAGEKGEIILKANKEKETIILRIIDSGDGVPDAEISRIFDPLYRVEKDRTRKTGGSGLGLAIVKTCVEVCDGKVAAKNLEPKGFEITFILQSANSEN